jgi:hypothetical protein
VKLGPLGTVITLLTALALLVPAPIGVFLSGVPTVFSPFPALTVIPALMLAQWHLEYGAALLPSLLFLLWNPQLFRAEGKIPKRSYVLFALLAALSAVDFVLSWKWGLQFQGPQYTAMVCSINIAWIGFLGLAFRRCLNTTPSFRTSLFLHWMLFALLCWYAFPWLGELI